jgi:hypothetical protein
VQLEAANGTLPARQRQQKRATANKAMSESAGSTVQHRIQPTTVSQIVKAALDEPSSNYFALT